MKRASVCLMAVAGLTLAGPVLADSIKLQIKGAY
jgi:hypothetical protein